VSLAGSRVPVEARPHVAHTMAGFARRVLPTVLAQRLRLRWKGAAVTVAALRTGLDACADRSRILVLDISSRTGLIG